MLQANREVRPRGMGLKWDLGRRERLGWANKWRGFGPRGKEEFKQRHDVGESFNTHTEVASQTSSLNTHCSTHCSRWGDLRDKRCRGKSRTELEFLSWRSGNKSN